VFISKTSIAEAITEHDDEQMVEEELQHENPVKKQGRTPVMKGENYLTLVSPSLMEPSETMDVPMSEESERPVTHSPGIFTHLAPRTSQIAAPEPRSVNSANITRPHNKAVPSQAKSNITLNEEHHLTDNVRAASRSVASQHRSSAASVIAERTSPQSSQPISITTRQIEAQLSHFTAGEQGKNPGHPQSQTAVMPSYHPQVI
jgi:hypothetical protein